MKYLFRGGTVVSGRGTRRADVLVEDEKILRVARSITAPEAAVIDVEGQLLLPGFIDAHTHFDLDVCSTTTVDDFSPAAGRLCGAAPPRWWTSPAPTRARLCTRGWSCGTRRPTAIAAVTTASI